MNCLLSSAKSIRDFDFLKKIFKKFCFPTILRLIFRASGLTKRVCSRKRAYARRPVSCSVLITTFFSGYDKWPIESTNFEFIPPTYSTWLLETFQMGKNSICKLSMQVSPLQDRRTPLFTGSLQSGIHISTFPVVRCDSKSNSAVKNAKPTNGRSDGRMDGWTDGPLCKDARTHLTSVISVVAFAPKIFGNLFD